MKMQAVNTQDISKPIRDIAYETLKQAIITGELPAGHRIVETVYANKLHISRTPLREAFRKLELDGLVSCEVRRGVIVRAFTIDDIEEIYGIRNALMTLIIPSIIENITGEDIRELEDVLAEMDISEREADCSALAVQNRKFHRKIEQISNKKRILRVIDSQEEYIIRFSAMAIASIARRASAHQEHRLMLIYLRERNENKFADLMRRHMEESKSVCLKAVEGHVGNVQRKRA